MLHILNGESTLEVLRNSSLPGEFYSFRDALIGGPTPAGAEGRDWFNLRASHLADAYGLEQSKRERELQQQDDLLVSCAQHDEVVLWFDHDLFCQVNLLYLLNRLSQIQLGSTILSLICIGEFPGVDTFRGLGQLTKDQLEGLFPNRQQLTLKQLESGTSAWAAYCSASPTSVLDFIEDNTSALPFVAPALLNHLRRFPSTGNGVGRIEQRALELVSGGLRPFSELFAAFAKEEPAFGLGDFQIWLSLRKLAEARQPLLTMKHGAVAGQELNAQVLRHTQIEMTRAGDAVLKGENDFIAMSGMDEWLGGVHLVSGQTLWRWNERARRLVRE